MTYKEVYNKSKSPEDLVAMVKYDTMVAIILGNNPDRIKTIETAMNEIAREKNWQIDKVEV